MIATCAWCGEKKELCDTPWIDEIKQPRACKECLIKHMQDSSYECKDLFWIIQLQETNEMKSLRILGILQQK